MVSCKFLYDDGETDEVFLSEWAASGGTTVKELIKLEKDFLKAIVCSNFCFIWIFEGVFRIGKFS